MSKSTTTSHFADLTARETACIQALVDDKLEQVKNDPSIPKEVILVLMSIKDKMSDSPRSN